MKEVERKEKYRKSGHSGLKLRGDNKKQCEPIGTCRRRREISRHAKSLKNRGTEKDNVSPSVLGGSE